MNARFRIATMFGLWIVIAGLLFWLRGGNDTAAPVRSPVAGVPASPAAPSQTPAVAATVQPATAPVAAPAVFAPPIASEEERIRTRDDRLAALPLFLKGADESIAMIRKQIEDAKAAGAPQAEIIALETRLQQMQAAKQQVLARNADIAMAR